MRFWLGVMGVLLVAMLPSGSTAQRPPQPPGLSSFSSDAELRRFLRQLRAQRQPAIADIAVTGVPLPPSPPPPPPPPPSAPPPVAAQSEGGIVTTAARSAPNAITNTQVAGVDEGGIVKLSGDMLVILRRGRLFTVSLAGGGMRPLASADAYPPGVDGSGDWYDEMLLSGDRIIVIGYSYNRGGTEVNRFRLGRDGSIRFEDSTQLKSNDYYSSRNYASRLIGSKLIYYTPLYLEFGDDPLASLPAIRRWQPGLREGGWRRIVAAQRVFVPEQLRSAGSAGIDTVHSVTTCDLAAPSIDCTATAVLGAGSRTFFVSSNAVYIWTGPGWSRGPGPARALLYRLPLDQRARPQAVGVRGAPIDQFSFGPDERRSALNVLVRAEGGGDAMWQPETPQGALALVRIPMSSFGTGSSEVARERYQRLPRVNGWSIQNRFVGDHLLYGAGGEERVNVVGVGDGRIDDVALPHVVSRIDMMGSDAIVVGESRRGLGFSTVALNSGVERTDTFVLPAAREGETRSHAFFFRPDTADGRSGMVGLPVARARSEGTRFLGNSAAIQFLARNAGRLADAGDLEARGVDPRRNDDGCVASCVDWYGNARPIFWNGRVFALMGYELVEGRERAARIREAARINFAPRGRERAPLP